MGLHRIQKSFNILNPILKNVIHDSEIDLFVLMDYQISETYHWD